MRKKTVRSGVRFITFGILCLMVVTFFHAQLSTIFFLGYGGDAHVTLLGFFLGWLFGGLGVVIAAAGLLLQGRGDESRLRLAPSVLVLLTVVFLFFFLVYNSFTQPPSPQLQRGQSITI
jgi:hypothetical protein